MAYFLNGNLITGIFHLKQIAAIKYFKVQHTNAVCNTEFFKKYFMSSKTYYSR